jgi:hypothetical protein
MKRIDDFDFAKKFQTIELERKLLKKELTISKSLYLDVKQEKVLQDWLKDELLWGAVHWYEYGYRKEKVLEYPATWWDHLKQTLKQKHPKVFHWLRVNVKKETIKASAMFLDFMADSKLSEKYTIVYMID